MLNYEFHSAQPVLISTHMDSSLMMTSFCHSDSYPEWSFPLHIHRDQLEISYVLSGHGLFTLNTTVYPVQAGDLMVAEAGYIHAHCSLKQDPLNMIVLQFSWNSKENREQVLLPVNTLPVIPTGKHRPYFQASFQLLDRLLREKEIDEGLCRQVVGSCLALLMRLPLKEIVDISQKSTFTRDILVYINENFSSNITLKTLSDRFAVSSSHISNEFTRIYGCLLYTSRCV